MAAATIPGLRAELDPRLIPAIKNSLSTAHDGGLDPFDLEMHDPRFVARISDQIRNAALIVDFWARLRSRSCCAPGFQYLRSLCLGASPKYIGPALTLCALLAFFQLVLRPGISF